MWYRWQLCANRDKLVNEKAHWKKTVDCGKYFCNYCDDDVVWKLIFSTNLLSRWDMAGTHVAVQTDAIQNRGNFSIISVFP